MLTNDLHTDAAAGQGACGERESSPQSCGYRGNDRHSSGVNGGFIVVYIHTFACFLCWALLLLFYLIKGDWAHLQFPGKPCQVASVHNTRAKNTLKDIIQNISP